MKRFPWGLLIWVAILWVIISQGWLMQLLATFGILMALSAVGIIGAAAYEWVNRER